MKQRIKQLLEALPHKDGDRLPSVRELAKLYDASTATVQGALGELAQEKKICRIQGKGCFWGAEFVSKAVPLIHETIAERLTKSFDRDFDSGFLKPSVPLPHSKGLAQRYNVSLNTLRKFLDAKVNCGLLKRIGRQYFFTQSRIITKRTPLSEIIFVTRCNSWGGFAPESERELDFLRLVYKKAGAECYKLSLLGINESTGKLVDRSGNERKVSDYPNAVGAILSTLLVQKFEPLLHFFAGVKYPVAVWWEHPESFLPSVYLRKPNWNFFNFAFGKYPGAEVGRYLLSQGVREVNYFSPYHNSSWSKDRLAGLEDAGIKVQAYVDSEFASPWDYKEIVRKKVEKYSVEGCARSLEKEKMLPLVKAAIRENEGGKIVPWVCVNDETAGIIMEILDELQIELEMPQNGPQFLAFDNSIESYLLRLPSYEFNTEALVDQIFYSIATPSEFGDKKKLHNILGNVVEK